MAKLDELLDAIYDASISLSEGTVGQLGKDVAKIFKGDFRYIYIKTMLDLNNIEASYATELNNTRKIKFSDGQLYLIVMDKCGYAVYKDSLLSATHNDVTSLRQLKNLINTHGADKIIRITAPKTVDQVNKRHHAKMGLIKTGGSRNWEFCYDFEIKRKYGLKLDYGWDRDEAQVRLVAKTIRDAGELVKVIKRGGRYNFYTLKNAKDLNIDIANKNRAKYAAIIADMRTRDSKAYDELEKIENTLAEIDKELFDNVKAKNDSIMKNVYRISERITRARNSMYEVYDLFKSLKEDEDNKKEAEAAGKLDRAEFYDRYIIGYKKDIVDHIDAAKAEIVKAKELMK